MRAAILCNGEFPRTDMPRYLLKSADVIVCCDGAAPYRRLRKLGLEPDAIVGDMDSTPKALQKRLEGLIVHDPGQDDNDLAKAFRYLRGRWPDADEIHIIGAGGHSEAHTLGNLSWLMRWEQELHLSAAGIKVDMVSDYGTAFAISQSCTLHVGEGRKVSIFSCDPALRIESEGLHWPTAGVVFDYWHNAALNRADADVISLTLSHPAPVLIILD